MHVCVINGLLGPVEHVFVTDAAILEAVGSFGRYIAYTH
jgi:hypothetical protein